MQQHAADLVEQEIQVADHRRIAVSLLVHRREVLVGPGDGEIGLERDVGYADPDAYLVPDLKATAHKGPIGQDDRVFTLGEQVHQFA